MDVDQGQTKSSLGLFLISSYLLQKILTGGLNNWDLIKKSVPVNPQLISIPILLGTYAVRERERERKKEREREKKFPREQRGGGDEKGIVGVSFEVSIS